MAEENKKEPRQQTPTEVIQTNERVMAERASKSMAAAEKSTGYVVAKGSLSTPRGIVDIGQPIGREDFEDEKFFKQRQDEGYIVAEAKK